MTACLNFISYISSFRLRRKKWGHFVELCTAQKCPCSHSEADRDTHATTINGVFREEEKTILAGVKRCCKTREREKTRLISSLWSSKKLRLLLFPRQSLAGILKESVSLSFASGSAYQSKSTQEQQQQQLAAGKEPKERTREREREKRKIRMKKGKRERKKTKEVSWAQGFH